MIKQPKLRTPENASRICELLAEGQSLRQIAKELHIKSASAITEWARDNVEFAAQYARGMEWRCHKWADEMLELADTPCMFNGVPDRALVQQLRVQIDTRKWLLSKLLPKQFGDKIVQELTSDSDRPVITRIELIGVTPERREDPGPVGGDKAAPPLKLATAR